MRRNAVQQGNEEKGYAGAPYAQSGFQGVKGGEQTECLGGIQEGTVKRTRQSFDGKPSNPILECKQKQTEDAERKNDSEDTDVGSEEILTHRYLASALPLMTHNSIAQERMRANKWKRSQGFEKPGIRRGISGCRAFHHHGKRVGIA